MNISPPSDYKDSNIPPSFFQTSRLNHAFQILWQKIHCYVNNIFHYDYLFSARKPDKPSKFSVPPIVLPIPFAVPKKKELHVPPSPIAAQNNPASPQHIPLVEPINLAYKPLGCLRIDNSIQAHLVADGFAQIFLQELKRKFIIPQQMRCAQAVHTHLTDISSSFDSILSLKNAVLKYFSQFITEALANPTPENFEGWMGSFLILKDLFRLNVSDLKTHFEKYENSAPEKIKPYIKPVLNWLYHLTKSKRLSSFNDFIPEVLNKDDYLTTMPTSTIVAYLSEGLVDYLFERIQSYHTPLQQAIAGSFFEAESIQKASKELFEENIHAITPILIKKILNKISRLNFADFIYDNLPHLKNHLEATLKSESIPSLRAEPSAEDFAAQQEKERLFLENIGTQLIDVFLTPELMVEVFNALQLPTIIRTPMGALLQNYLDRFVAGSLDEEQKETLQFFLKNKMHEGLAFVARKYLKTIIGSKLQYAFNYVLSPIYVRELLAETIVPNIVESLFIQMGLTVLFKHIDEFTDMFDALSHDDEMFHEISAKWYPLTIKEGGFTRFSLKDEKINAAKFAQIIKPKLLALQTTLKVYKQEHSQFTLPSKLVIKLIHNHFHKIYECKKEQLPLLSEVVQIVFKEAKIFEGSGRVFNYTVRPLIEKLGKSHYLSKLSYAILQSIPPTQSILNRALNRITEKYTVDATIDKKEMRIIDRKLLFDRAPVDPQQTNEMLNTQINLLSAILTDYLEKLVVDSTGRANVGYILSGAALSCIDQVTINNTIVKLVTRLFSSKEKCKDLIFPALDVAMVHLTYT